MRALTFRQADSLRRSMTAVAQDKRRPAKARAVARKAAIDATREYHAAVADFWREWAAR